MPQAQQSDTQVRRVDLPLADRQMEVRSFQRRDAEAGADAPLATAELVFTTGAPVQRYDWANGRYYVEELVVETDAIRLQRLQAGAPLLNTHSRWDLEAVLGVVDQPAISKGEGTCRVAFSRRDSVAGYVQDVADKIIRNVSVGYIRHRIEMIAPAELTGTWRYRVTDWEPMEVSLVPIPADPGAQVRDGSGQPERAEPSDVRTFPCEFIEVRAAGVEEAPRGGAAAASSTEDDPMKLTRIALAAAAGGALMNAEPGAAGGGAGGSPAAAAAPQPTEGERAAQAERQRSSEITDLCARHNVPQLASKLITDGKTVEEARKAVLDEIAVRDAAAGGHRNVSGGITTVNDETATRMAGIEEAILHRVMPNAKLTDNGRQYRGMSLLEIGREMLERANVSTRGMARMELAQRMLHFRSGMHSTSDFAHLLANVANKRLRNAYDENPGTYGRWARRAPNAPDFKSMKVVQLSGAPTLLRTNEHGEFKYGAMSDGAATYSLLTYGRIVSLNRQAVVNDDLRGFDRLVSAFGNSARRLENATVYSQLTANAAMADGTALFHADHSNLSTGGGSALAAAGLTAARTAMRKQTGLQGELLNIAPAYLLVPAALEQTAYQFTSTQYVPATKAEINEFRTGGRTALEPVVEPLLDSSSATAWYLAADAGQIDTVEYCYLDGEEGPVIESEMGFEVDGVSYKCRLDFAATPVDHRGLHKANGA
jgi:hypothetical protein